MKDHISATLMVAAGIIVGGVSLFGLYSLHQDHQNLQGVISFLTAAQQKAQADQTTTSTAPAIQK